MILLNVVGKGTYQRASNFARELAARGHQVSLMAIAPRARLRWRERDIDGVRLLETPDLLPGALRSGWDVWDVYRRVRWLSGRSFDIVHAYESRPVVLYPALAAQRRGAKLIMDWCDWFGRGGSVEERPNGLVRAMLRPLETFFEEHYRTRADGTLAINAFLRKRAIDLGVKPECTEVIRNGAVTHIAPTDRLAARREFGLPLEAPTIGYVGNIYTRDAELMAAAFDRVRRAMPDARLLLVGYFNRRIETWLEDAASVIRTGAVTFEQVYAYLSACDVCWLPLRDSGANRGRWPGKLNDYMTVGRAVVATAVGDLAEVIPQYRIGVVTRDDADEFARQTVELLHDARRREQMGKQARHAAEGDWSWARKTDTLENFYRRVLQTC